MPDVIATRRLNLVPGTAELLRVALFDPRSLGLALRARVPRTWPPGELDPFFLELILSRVLADPSAVTWLLYFVVLRADEQAARGEAPSAVIGTAGYKGPPSRSGSVEIGYGIVEEFQGRGYASEAMEALVQLAFRDSRVERIAAETFPNRPASLAVLAKCDFRPVGRGSAPGTLRFERSRADRPVAGPLHRT
jgi:RimJ/RimL family protein N-acetyltransferase